MRKIRKDEIIKISEEFTDIFRDYGAYRLFFDENALECGKRAFFLYEVFCAAQFTYTDDDHNVIASVKRPGDKETSSEAFFDDAVLSKQFYDAVDKKASDLAKEYVAFNEALAKRHYDPLTDCYIKNIGVAEKARGKGLLRKTVDLLCGDKPVYLETHCRQNVDIYEKLGFELVETADFHGVPVYAMKRKALSV